MIFRVYLRDANQRVAEKTTTGDPTAAVSAFEALVNREDLDGQKMLAVITRDGQQLAHHNFQRRPDGSPLYPENYWRGRAWEIPLVSGSLKPEMRASAMLGRPSEMDGGKRRSVYLEDATWQSALDLGDGNASAGIRKALEKD